MLALVVMGLLTLVGGIGLLVSTLLRLRRLRALAVVEALALLTGRNLPLVQGLAALAEGERGRMRRIYQRLAGRLAAGDPLSAALQDAVRQIPGAALGAVQSGEAAGALPAALHSAARELRQQRSAPDNAGIPWWYLLGVLLVLTVVVSNYTVVISPQLEAIWADFEMERLPGPTRRLLDVGTVAAAHIGPILLAFAVLLAAGVASFFGREFLSRVPSRQQWWARGVDALAWALPGTCTIASARALSRQLELMSAAVAAGRPLEVAARAAVAVDANWFARRRLERLAQRLEEGCEPVQAAREAALPGPVLGLLSSARDQQDLATGLAYLARYYQSLLVHWQQIISRVLSPLVVLPLGVAVAYVTAAILLPMVAIIDALIESY